MGLAKSDRGWMSGVAGDDVVTIGDPRLKATMHDTATLIPSSYRDILARHAKAVTNIKYAAPVL